jgi:predicted transposase YdaD
VRKPGKERGVVDVCLVNEVERLREEGLSAEEISATLGVEREWVREVLDLLLEDDPPRPG